MASSTPSFPRQVAGGAAAYLAAQGLAEWDNFGAGPHYTTASEWPVYIGPDMPLSPDRLIVITPGITTFHRGVNVTQAIQVRLRGSAGADGGEVADHMQAISDAFRPNGFPLAHVLLGTVPVGAVIGSDMLPLSPDGGRRHGYIQNFRIRARYAQPE